MSEFRQDITTSDWVLISEGRGKRPHEFRQEPAEEWEDLPEIDKTCVFCPGNEDKTPPEIKRYPDKGDWLVRVVPNKYKALEHTVGKIHQNFYISRSATGDHEVVITRYHDQPTALQDVKLIDLTLKAYADRMEALGEHEEVRYMHVIQNHGEPAGASVAHPHSQIFTTPFIPERIHEELMATKRYMEDHGACVYCEIILYELQERHRVVLDDEDFLVIAPYASKVPFQLRIMPKLHRANFYKITMSERKALARVMKEVFARLYERLGDPAYNYYFHTLPFPGLLEKRTHDHSEHYHWHLAVMPRFSKWAGFELGTEVYVNVVPPEKAAEFLR